MYGYNRYNSSSYRSRSRSSSNTPSYYKKGYTPTYRSSRSSYTRSPKFALTGFLKDTESKYCDRTFSISSLKQHTGSTRVPMEHNRNNGIMFISNAHMEYAFGDTRAPDPGVIPSVPSNLLANVPSGATIRNRIGNKISPRFVKGAVTFTAAVFETNKTIGDRSPMNGESLHPGGLDLKQQYMRTSYRMVLVKDSQVNSTDTFIPWQEVFETNRFITGVHSELSLKNLGRFTILSDRVFQLDADDPQITIPFNIRGSSIGNVRFNGHEVDSYTDKGVHILFSAFVMGDTSYPTDLVRLADPVGHSRLCFTDT